jgi:S-formylglutathione hydrolase
MNIVTRTEHGCFGGRQGFYTFDSDACAGPMRFAVFLPPQALAGQRVPVLYFLAGLTCTEETFAMKAGAQRRASALGMAIVTCDTSPRSARFQGDDVSWDFGQGAGFYIDATQAPWSSAYRMETFVTQELSTIVESNFPIDGDARGIFGHSMGGHGALTLALRHPHRYRSVSAFAPIVAPSEVPWGQRAFASFLGDDRTAWRRHDACALIADGATFSSPPLVDQGRADKFLHDQLQPHRLQSACGAAGQPLQLREHDSFDHGYYFISSLIDDHLDHHHHRLTR